MPNITCVRKDNKGNITHVGIPSLITEQDAIKRVAGGEEFQVVRSGMPTVKVGVRPKNKPEYLATEPDGERLNNLSKLPTC